MLPKIRDLDDMMRVDEYITRLEYRIAPGNGIKRKLLVPIATETPMGVLNLKHI